MFEWYSNHLSEAWNTTFVQMDNFGHDHWGFILAFVFLWWLGDHAIVGIQSNLARLRQRNFRRLPLSNFRRARPNLGGVGFGQRSDTVRNLGIVAVQENVGFTPRDSGRHDVEVVIDRHRASSQAGLASFRGQSSRYTPPAQPWPEEGPFGDGPLPE